MAIAFIALANNALAEDSSPSFTEDRLCIECHAIEGMKWSRSHHAQAMAPADEKSVLGDFDNATFIDAGEKSRFFRRGGKFFVNTTGEDGAPTDFEVKYTFGVYPLQQYLLALPKGRLQAFTVAWDAEKGRWFDLYPDERIAPEDPLHWTRRAFTANSSCIECHTTNYSLDFDADQGRYASTWSAPNVGCQACHGPGGRHVELARDANHARGSDSGLLAGSAAKGGKTLVENCASCHSRRYPLTPDDDFGGAYLDDFMPELLREGRYHADGQVLDEVYVYGSFLQSKMHQRGVSCNDCHDPHDLSLRIDGNGLCLSCHNASPPKGRFPTLKAAAYDTPEHHFHGDAAGGDRCVECHMPATTFMGIDSRRDHGFSVPRPDLTEAYAIPNACNRCHTDQSPAWASRAMDEWYGNQWRQRPTIAHALHAGRNQLPEAGEALRGLLDANAQPAMVRASALELLLDQADVARTDLIDGLKDPSPLVRAALLRRLDIGRNPDLAKPVIGQLGDPVRAVRIEAARVLADYPRSELTSEQRARLDTALAEYIAAQTALGDYPQGRVNLAQLYTRMGRTDEAVEAYQRAIALDDRFLPAYLGLARLQYALGRKPLAEQHLRRAVEIGPDSGDSHYLLALLLSEQGEEKQALEHLQRAAGLMPENARVHYNLGLLLIRLKRFAEAKAALERALELNPSDPRTRQALGSLPKPGK
jgi:predicted CXXCH cytochrome family protein